MNEALLAEGIRLLRTGALADAAQLARHALSKQPDEAAAHYLLGLCHAQQEQPAAAIEHLRRALAGHPQAPAEWHANIANLLMQQQETEAAITHFQQALALKPALLPAQLSLADLLHGQGRPDAAIPHYRQALALDPQSLAAATGLAYALLALGQEQAALQVANTSLASQPDVADAHALLGNLHSELVHGDAARAAYAAALRLVPGHRLAAVNQALTWRIAGDFPETYRRLLALQREQPDMREVHHQLAHSVASECRQNAGTTTPASSPADSAPSTDGLISIIVCSIDPAKLAATTRMYRQLFAGQTYELIHIGDARSLSEGYNRGLAQSRGELLIFAHDDLDILNPDFVAIIRRQLAHYDLLGVAGTRHLLGNRWGDAGWPHQHGWVAHPGEDGGVDLSIFRVFAASAEHIEGIDGLFFAVRRQVAEALRFDEQTFDGFHFYDLDFSYRTFLAGYRLAVCNELTIVHHSRGRFDARWADYAARFMDKHRATLPTEPAASGSAATLHFADNAELARYCRRHLAVLAEFGPAVP